MDNKTSSINGVMLFEDIELRTSVDEATKLPVVEGLAVPYEKRSKLLYGLFYEIFKPYAFREHLATKPNIPMYNNHNTDQVLARTKNGTLTLTEDDKGITFRSVLNDTSYANDLVKLINRGDVEAMSFGFRYLTRDWGMSDGEELCIVHKAEMREISPVSNPAYEDTSIYKRSAEEIYKDLKAEKERRQQAINDEIDMMKRKLELMSM
jgi:hypothetical protein